MVRKGADKKVYTSYQGDFLVYVKLFPNNLYKISLGVYYPKSVPSFIDLSAGSYKRSDSLLILKDSFAKSNMVFKYTTQGILAITSFPFLNGKSLRTDSDPGDFISPYIDTCGRLSDTNTHSKAALLASAYFTAGGLGPVSPKWFRFFFRDAAYEFYFDSLLLSSGYFYTLNEAVLLFDRNGNEMSIELRDGGSTLVPKKFYTISPFCELHTR